MSSYEVALLLAGCAAYVVSALCRSARGQFWIAVILADLVASTAYWRAGLPLADAATAACDFVVALLVYVLGRYRWELWIMLLYWTSMLVSFVDLAARMNHDAYSSVLELINYVAFATIGVTASFQRSGRGVRGADRSWRGLRPAWLPLLGEVEADRGE